MELAGIERLKELGFSQGLLQWVQVRIGQGFRRFFLPDRVQLEAGLLRCLLELELLPATSDIILVQYEAMFQLDLVIDHLVTGELDTRQLEKAMQGINWNTHAFSKGYLLQYGQLDITLEQQVAVVLSQLKQLTSAGGQGAVVNEQLQLKYWFDTSFSREYLDGGNLDAIGRKYFPYRIFNHAQGLVPVTKAAELLQPRRGTGSLPHKRKSAASARGYHGKHK